MPRDDHDARYDRAPRRDAGPPREADAEDARLRELSVFMAKGLVDHPDEVRVDVLTPGEDAILELSVHPHDLGHVIGKQGRTARAMRLALSASAARTGRKADLEIAD